VGYGTTRAIAVTRPQATGTGSSAVSRLRGMHRKIRYIGMYLHFYTTEKFLIYPTFFETTNVGWNAKEEEWEKASVGFAEDDYESVKVEAEVEGEEDGGGFL